MLIRKNCIRKFELFEIFGLVWNNIIYHSFAMATSKILSHILRPTKLISRCVTPTYIHIKIRKWILTCTRNIFPVTLPLSFFPNSLLCIFSFSLRAFRTILKPLDMHILIPVSVCDTCPPYKLPRTPLISMYIDSMGIFTPNLWSWIEFSKIHEFQTTA